MFLEEILTISLKRIPYKNLHWQIKEVLHVDE